MVITSRFLACLSVIFAIAASTVVSTTCANTNAVDVVLPTIYMGTTQPGALIKISPAFPSGLGGCSYTTGDFVFIDFATQTAPNGRDLYATVLAAFLAGRQVAFGTSGCSSGGYPLV